MGSANVLALEATGISKSFPGVNALADVDFSLKKGEVRALVGKNGAGKSTLIKILTGIYVHDKGRIVIDGQEISDITPQATYRLGVRTIYQDNDLVPYFTVAESIMLHNEPKRFFGLIIDRRELNNRAAQILRAKLGVELDPRLLVGTLSVLQQQLVSIAKNLVGVPRIMILDEPTAALSAAEIRRLFEVIANLKKQGVSVIYISHRLEEIFEIAQSVTVLRDGKKVADLDLSATSESEVIRFMVGEQEFNSESVRKVRPASAECALSVRGLSSGILRDVSFDLHVGEIVGVYGAEGAGQQELAWSICGKTKAKLGEIRLFNRLVDLRTSSAAVKNGIGSTPRNRKESGLVARFSIQQNMTLAKLKDFSRLGLLQRGKEEAAANEQIRNLSILGKVSTLAANLSGGNQQKVVIAKWIVASPTILILDYPTIGIDIAAKNEVYRILIGLADRGMSLILITPEYDEISRLCDRALILRKGKVVRVFSAEEFGEREFLRYAIGSDQEGT